MGETFRPIRGDQVILFEAESGAQVLAIDSRLDRDDIPAGQGIVPLGIEPGNFMGIKTDAMAEVVKKRPAFPPIEPAFGKIEQISAGDAWTEPVLHLLENRDHAGMGFLLGLAGSAPDDETAAQI